MTIEQVGLEADLRPYFPTRSLGAEADRHDARTSLPQAHRTPIIAERSEGDPWAALPVHPSDAITRSGRPPAPQT
ncbi:MAG: hypothetical protein V2I43_03830, partial [Parvularcula sp.]|nr:hypothetical protein [Parvularcula sp.]